jgi:hypothetical protein
VGPKAVGRAIEPEFAIGVIQCPLGRSKIVTSEIIIRHAAGAATVSAARRGTGYPLRLRLARHAALPAISYMLGVRAIDQSWAERNADAGSPF